MATRSNIAIKNANETKVIYHHWDGYPSGVGQELLDAHLKTLDDTTPTSLMSALIDLDDGYKYTDGTLHGDIEYLYIIDTDQKKLTCYSLDIWNTKDTDEDIINGHSKDTRLVFETDYKTTMFNTIVLQ